MLWLVSRSMTTVARSPSVLTNVPVNRVADVEPEPHRATVAGHTAGDPVAPGNGGPYRRHRAVVAAALDLLPVTLIPQVLRQAAGARAGLATRVCSRRRC
jgi:hypothetical protein